MQNRSICRKIDFPKTLIFWWTVVQKSTLHISELMVKSHLHLVRIWYQNQSTNHLISGAETHLKQTSSLDAVCVSKVFQNEIQNDSKMLDRNWWQTALGPTWRHQAWLLVSQTLSQAPKLLTLTSYSAYLVQIFDLFRLFWHHFQTRFRLQSSTHNSYIEIPCSQLADQTS